MIQHLVTQGSQQWHHLRSTIPTASNFDRLVSPAKWAPTKGEALRNFALEVLANRIFGLAPEDQFSSAAMAHGREWEPIARAAYEFERGVVIEDGGFFTDDAEAYGASPDGLIGEHGLVEFKNPASPKVHLAALYDCMDLGQRGQYWTEVAASGSDLPGFVRDHWAQVQGQLLVTGRQWCDLVSNFSRLPMVVVRIYPNETYQAILQSALTDFCQSLDRLTKQAKELGWYRETVPMVAGPIGDLGITDEDITKIIAARSAQKEVA